MGFRFMRPKARSDIIKSAESQRVLNLLEDFLDSSVPTPMRFLTRMWQSQAAVLTYAELRRIVDEEEIPQEIMETWHRDYANILAERMTPEWKSAMIAGASSKGLGIESAETQVMEWIVTRTGELATNCCDGQRDAIKYIVAESIAGGTSSAEVAHYIRGTVGLTKPQASANLRHYNAVKAQLREEYPRMKASTIEQRARRSAARYAEVQHRYRAETIARTELATAYHHGNDMAIRQAIDQGLMPQVKKVWSTSRDDKVCQFCASLEGVEVELDSAFRFGDKEVLIPPAHPRCGCAVKYIEVNTPAIQPEPEQLMELTPDEETTGYREMTEAEYEEWQSENSTEKKLLSDFEQQYGVKLNPNGQLRFQDDKIIESEGEWLSDILTSKKDDLYNISNRQGHCGYIQDADGSKAINAYLRRGEVGLYSKKNMEGTIESMKRLIDVAAIPDNITVDRWAGIDVLERMGISVGTHGETTRIGHAFVTQDLDLTAILDGVNEQMVGQQIVDKGFMSASACSSANVFQGSDVKFKIQVPEGTKAFVSENKLESELVFAPGTKQEVLGARIIETEAKNWDDERIPRKAIEILVRIIGS